MRIIEPSFEIMTDIDGEAILRRIELAARNCYKSEGKIGPGSAEKLIRKILRLGHESVIEHEGFTVRVICDRGVTHEIVRHRLCAYSQESTRYCDYSGEVTFIRPPFWEENSTEFAFWQGAMHRAEEAYQELRALGASPQEARSVLPNSLKTEIVWTANLREWRHIFRLRCSPAAHPQMRQVMIPLFRGVKALIPVIFDDLEFEE